LKKNNVARKGKGIFKKSLRRNNFGNWSDFNFFAFFCNWLHYCKTRGKTANSN